MLESYDFPLIFMNFTHFLVKKVWHFIIFKIPWTLQGRETHFVQKSLFLQAFNIGFEYRENHLIFIRIYKVFHMFP